MSPLCGEVLHQQCTCLRNIAVRPTGGLQKTVDWIYVSWQHYRRVGCLPGCAGGFALHSKLSTSVKARVDCRVYGIMRWYQQCHCGGSLIGAVWLRSVVWTMDDCVTVAAASLGPYDCVTWSALWATAWLLLLLHWDRMTAFCFLDYGRLRDCCCCVIGAVCLRYVVSTMGDCVTAAAAYSDRMTAFGCLDYGRLRDCCCCVIGAVWLRYVVSTMGDCVTAAAASLGRYDCALLYGLWTTAWLLLLRHWGGTTALCCMDYGRLRDCCCCVIGAVRLRSVVWTMDDCVTAAAASLGP